MAAPMVFRADDLLLTINGIIDSLLQQHNVPVNGINVGKRNNDFSKGDIFLSRGRMEISEQVMSTVHKSLIEELTKRSCYIKTVCQDKFNCIVIHLLREKYFKTAITSVMTEKDKYGISLGQETEITVTNANFQRKDNEEAQSTAHGECLQMSFDSMRSLVLEEHLTHLLKANGYRVTNILPESQADTVKGACTCLGIDPIKYTMTAVSDEDIDHALKSLEGQRCFHRNKKNVSSTDLPQNETLEFDIKSLLEERRLPVGKTGFDKNLHICSVTDNGKSTHVLKQAVMIKNSIQGKKLHTLMHIEGQSLSFTSQKVDLLLKALTGLAPVKQLHFVHGSITKAKGSESGEEFNTDAYLKLRYSQMKDAAEMKYGKSVQGKGWEDTLRTLTFACVKFELLSNHPRNTVKLKWDASEENSIENSLQGSFVMYNCARLATLLTHFEDSVQQGTYPPLPSVESIDFSTLREEEEWGLLFNYVYPYPDLVKETIKGVNTEQSVFTSLHTHKICQMLIGLTRSVSSYYSRYHVLGEPRPHLLPTMYARLYLLKSVHQVMTNSLGLLGITPLSQL